jgi:hypothetical protein
MQGPITPAALCRALVDAKGGYVTERASLMIRAKTTFCLIFWISIRER